MKSIKIVQYHKLSTLEIVKRYTSLAYELGVVPGGKHISNCSYLCSYPTIIERFGSLKELRRQCGIFHPNEQSGKPLKALVEKNLLRLRIERGRRLDSMEINNYKEVPCYNYIKRIYDNRPLKEIWTLIEDKIPSSLSQWKK